MVANQFIVEDRIKLENKNRLLKKEYSEKDVLLNEVLLKLNTPEKTREALSKALYYKIMEGGNLFKFLTVEEVMIIDKWVSSRTIPENFPKSLANEISDEFGIEFKEDRDEGWKELFRNKR